MHSGTLTAAASRDNDEESTTAALRLQKKPTLCHRRHLSAGDISEETSLGWISDREAQQTVQAAPPPDNAGFMHPPPVTGHMNMRAQRTRRHAKRPELRKRRMTVYGHFVEESFGERLPTPTTSCEGRRYSLLARELMSDEESPAAPGPSPSSEDCTFAASFERDQLKKRLT